MLVKGKKKTKQTLTRLRNQLDSEEKILVGARYDSSMLDVDVPIATHIDEFQVGNVNDPNKNWKAQAVIWFRPVGNAQINAIRNFKEISNDYGMGDFLDETLKNDGSVNTGFQANLVGADSAISEIQEIPYDLFFVNPEVYTQQVTIKGLKLTQVTLKDRIKVAYSEVNDITQELVLLITDKQYDDQSLLGYYAEKELNKTEGIKLLQLISNGSLVQQVIGSISIHSKGLHSTTYPLFNDFSLTFFLGSENKSIFSAQCDVGVTNIPEEMIEKIDVSSFGPAKYLIYIHCKNFYVTILLG